MGRRKAFYGRIYGMLPTYFRLYMVVIDIVAVGWRARRMQSEAALLQYLPPMLKRNIVVGIPASALQA
jgi:hypothetical protein